MSRWVSLVTTSPSGKALFVCRMCGRTSPMPDRDCGEPPKVAYGSSASCAFLEEAHMALDLIEHGRRPMRYTVWSPGTFSVNWEDDAGERQRAILHVVNGNDLELLLRRVAEKADDLGLTAKQRADILAEPTGSAE